MAFADDVMRPVGDTGLAVYGGVLYDYQYQNLRGDAWNRIVAEMQLSPVIRGMLFAVEMIIRRAEWNIQPASGPDIDDEEAQEVADFVEGCRRDMYTPWEDTLAMFLSFLPYGYSVFEQLYKRRLGPGGDPASMFDDGRIGWDDWSPRPQDSIVGWEFDKAGRPNAVKQRTRGTYGPGVKIPLNRCLHFRAGGYKGSPEGESVLKAAYIDWDAIKKLQTMEAIGMERDLAGLPVALVPPRYLQADREPDEEAFYKQIRKIVTGIRNNEQSGVVFPLEFDSAGHSLYEFKLMSSGGARQFDTNAVIARRTSQMTMALLADFLTLGHGATGSYALSKDKTELFEIAISAWLDMIANVIVDQAFLPLMQLNAIDPALTPGLVGTPPDSEDLGRTGAYVAALLPLIQAVGVEKPDLVALVEHLFGLADLPAPTATIEALKDEEANPPEPPIEPIVSPDDLEPGAVTPNPAEPEPVAVP